MPGHRLQIGEHGDISYRPRGDKVTASLYYRRHDGRRRRIEATADTRTAARRKALAILEERMTGGAPNAYPSSTTFADVAQDWLTQLDELVDAGRRSPSTVALYRHALDKHVLPTVGKLRLQRVDAGAARSLPAPQAEPERLFDGQAVPRDSVRSLWGGGTAGRAAGEPGPGRVEPGDPRRARGAGSDDRGDPRVARDP